LHFQLGQENDMPKLGRSPMAEPSWTKKTSQYKTLIHANEVHSTPLSSIQDDDENNVE